MKRLTLLFAILGTFAPLYLSAQVTYTTDTTCYVKVTYSGNSAAIVVSSDIKDYITASVNGGDVSITSTASGTVNEISYGLYGTTTDGSFTLIGTYKATLELFGVNISNPTGPAINLQNGKRIEISAKSGTTSTLADGTSTATDAWKGALYCKGHIQFKGKGTLNVYGNYAHAIKAGEFNLSGYGDDGLQVALEANDTSAGNTGNFTMTGGTININTYGSTGESVKIAGTKSVAAAASLNVFAAQGMDQVLRNRVQCTKTLRDGVLLIERNGKTYSITGKEIQS